MPPIDSREPIQRDEDQDEDEDDDEEEEDATRRRRRRPVAGNSFIILNLLLLFWSSLIVDQVRCVAVHEVRFIASKTGRQDYALTNETIELSCHYLMKDDLEDIKQLVWSKDGQNILRWRKGELGLKVLSYAYKGHIDNSSTQHHIIIHNVTIEMHGKYKCSIRTDLGADENEQNVVVITQPACRLGDWRIRTDPSQCRETLVLDCRQMFPRPAPACRLWNGKLEKTIMGLSVDISEEPAPEHTTSVITTATTTSATTKRQQTYRVRYVQQFDLLPWPQQQQQLNATSTSRVEVKNKPISPAYLLQFAGHLWLKCDIVVPETSWRLSLTRKLFDYADGCNQDPLEAIAKWRRDYSHYAAEKMQQAGFLSTDKRVEDFELLPSQLKYELVAPKSGQQVELNCWRKPKLGTLAKLSCSQPSSLQLIPHQLQAHLNQLNHRHRLLHKSSTTAAAAAAVRLKGASVLQCGEFGWFPVKTSINSADSRLRKILKQRASGNSTALVGAKGEIPQQKNPTPEDGSELTYIQAIDSNDLEDDNDNSALSTKATTAAAPEDDSLDIIPSAAAAATTHTDPLLLMQPSELAALLPTCVSLASPSSRKSLNTRLHQQQQPFKDHDLIMQDGGRQTTNTLESAHRARDSSLIDDLSSIFNFQATSSGCARGSTANWFIAFGSSLLALLLSSLLHSRALNMSS